MYATTKSSFLPSSNLIRTKGDNEVWKGSTTTRLAFRPIESHRISKQSLNICASIDIVHITGGTKGHIIYISVCVCVRACALNIRVLDDSVMLPSHAIGMWIIEMNIIGF